MTRLRAALLAAIALAMPGTALAELIVVRSSGPSAPHYRVGTRFPDNHNFVLRQGDRITLLRTQGRSVTLRGPAAGILAVLERSRANVNRPHAAPAILRGGR